MVARGMSAPRKPQLVNEATMPPASSTNRSTSRATASTETRMISGAKAWASNGGAVKARSIRGASKTSVAGGGATETVADLTDGLGDRGVGDVEDQPRDEAEHDDQGEDRHPGD